MTNNFQDGQHKNIPHINHTGGSGSHNNLRKWIAGISMRPGYKMWDGGGRMIKRGSGRN